MSATASLVSSRCSERWSRSPSNSLRPGRAASSGASASWGRLDDIHEIRARIVASIIAALEIQIPQHEATLARLAGPESLQAWSLYHLGLQHLHRFNRTDNLTAQALFERAIAKEPSFARAHAGLSSTWFQSAF